MAPFTRRQLLPLLGLPLAGCLIPSRRPPEVWHPRYPLGPLRSPRRGAGLWIGAASVDLTPPADRRVYLAGYGFGRTMSRVRDPISARALYLDDGRRPLALLVADVVGLLQPTVARVRRLVGPGCELAIASTHNHQGPDTMGYWGPALLAALPYRTGIDEGYQRVFERRLALAVADAAARARPARLACGRGEVPRGLVRNLREPGVLDPELTVLEAREADGGAVIATWVNFACHPETLGDRARSLSADFPGVLRDELERRRGGVALYTNGALGGMITPALDDGAGEAERAQVARALGLQAAEAAEAALAAAEPVERPRVRLFRAPLELTNENPLFRYVTQVGLVEPRLGAAPDRFPTEVARLDLGPASLALVPGEPTPRVGLRIKQALSARGVRYPAVVGLGGDELGYLLDPAQYDDPEFSYESSVSVGRAAAPSVEAALAALPPPGA